MKLISDKIYEEKNTLALRIIIPKTFSKYQKKSRDFELTNRKNVVIEKLSEYIKFKRDEIF